MAKVKERKAMAKHLEHWEPCKLEEDLGLAEAEAKAKVEEKEKARKEEKGKKVRGKGKAKERKEKAKDLDCLSNLSPGRTLGKRMPQQTLS